MQEKRSLFPRFYFIGDDDLLEILGQATNPAVIQTHLKKLFAGIHSVQFDDDKSHILAMKSLDGEVVPLRNKIQINPKVEVSQYSFYLHVSHSDNSFIHSRCFCSASSSPLQLRGAPNYSTTVSELTRRSATVIEGLAQGPYMG